MVPAVRWASAKMVSHDVATGERSPCMVPATTRRLSPFSRNSGISAAPVWAKAGAVSSSLADSATHNCNPCSGSPPSPDRQRGAEAVAMHDLAVE